MTIPYVFRCHNKSWKFDVGYVRTVSKDCGIGVSLNAVTACCDRSIMSGMSGQCQRIVGLG